MFLQTLFPGLEPKPWKYANLAQEYEDNYSDLDMKNVDDQNRLLDLVSEQGRYRTWGGFGEDRTRLWAGFEPTAKYMIHLGIDFNNLPVGQPVGSLADGQVIHSMFDMSSFNGWGGRVMILSGDIVHLYGHLQNEDKLPLGARVEKGDVVGKVASELSNGSWFVHSHNGVMSERYVNQFRYNLAKLDGYELFENRVPDGVLDPIQVFGDICVHCSKRYLCIDPSWPLCDSCRSGVCQ